MPSTPPRPSDRTLNASARRAAVERGRASGTPAGGRRCLLVFGLIALAAAGVAVVIVLATAGGAAPRHSATGGTPGNGTSQSAEPPAKPPPPSTYAVGLHVLRLVDSARTITLPNGSTEPRPLVTYVRYPALGSSGGTDLPDAPAARPYGPFPLVVFGHGFAVTPALYQRLLQSWTHAGYVVAAPVFPLENANAPGGPNEGDLSNQPADMSFVISSLLAASSAGSGPLAGLIDPSRIAVAGQSDGGDTALAVAYNEHFRDPRVGAAVILSGAEMPGVSGFTFPAGSPPLLATQGTADTVNPPSLSDELFHAAQRPKYLLSLTGAAHLPPYSVQQPQLGIVERVTLAFLDGYLKSRPEALQRLKPLGSVAGKASLIAEP